MAQRVDQPVTPRAYTLRLTGVNKNDNSWRDALWRTHEAVNKGAQVFGDWLLTLRGGLDHTLAEIKVKCGKGVPDRDPTEDERKSRRILLALSWLSVESELGSPKKYIIKYNKYDAKDKNEKVIAALEEILKNRGVAETEIEQWIKDCSASLSAAIRDDAVWVNRSKAFDDAVKTVGNSLNREEVWDMLEPFFVSRNDYLAPAKGSEDESSDKEQKNKEKDLVQKARQWLSSRFGTGKGADFRRMANVYEKIAEWASNASKNGKSTVDDLAGELSKHFCTKESKETNGFDFIIGLSSYIGHSPNPVHDLLRQNKTLTETQLIDLNKKASNRSESCRAKIGSKGHRPYADVILKDVESVCGFTYLQNEGAARLSEFSVMLDHAARRVSLAHTWIKRAEAERRKFERDTQRIVNVPSSVKNWLDYYCSERSQASGALEPYRIRRRAIDGWEEVIAAWSRSSCSTSTERINAVRALQDDPEIEKFGDIQLFEALAEDDALCVWQRDVDAAKANDPQPLIDYVFATEAEFKKRHFKVPMYRHPDELLHPVFCDFGESRWDIDFSVHRNAKTVKKSKAKEEQQSNPRELCLNLWTGYNMEPVRLRWQSKRLAHDLALGQKAQNNIAYHVARADRLGRAAVNADKNDLVRISGLFEQKHWNGRLQAPRQQLDAIAFVRSDRNLTVAERERRMSDMRNRIRWLVTFSAKLQQKGPWIDYSSKFSDGDPAKPFVSKDGEYAVKHIDNQKRKGYAKLVLSRLPGLRVLSVDLGHRSAAACAVWEAMSSVQVEEACRAAGHEGPKESDLYIHLKKNNNTEVKKTSVYRRIGADTLPNGTKHPAPWAMLDRQFLIKLQGEEEGVREASNDEIWGVHQLEAGLGRTTPLIDRLVSSGWGVLEKQKRRLEELASKGWRPAEKTEASEETNADEEGNALRPSLSVDELMSSAVRSMRLALKRHGDRARIAHYLVADEKAKPGGIKEKLDDKGRVEMLLDAFELWRNLFTSRGWRDEEAGKLWDERIATLPGYNAPTAAVDEDTIVVRKKKQNENREKLHGVATVLAKDVDLRNTLHGIWRERWEKDDDCWKKRLRWFKDWILPRGKAAHDTSIRRVGGLSLTRLATITEFRRKIQVGFFTRLKPDGTRAEIKECFGQKVLDALERMREQRVKQLSSRIAEAALGSGRTERPKKGKYRERPTKRIDEPCHAIVIENLTHYRPRETRTRRENRQLMTWSASRIKKYLSESCQINGLHLREVPAGYTSLQDSRTGAPGIRCRDVPIMEFMRSPFWRKRVKKAEAKLAENKAEAKQADKGVDSIERYLCTLNEMWKEKSQVECKKAGAVRLPQDGGEIFVSADSNSPAAGGIQADLNAAANIGLRALTDPDWPGSWWYVPCEAGSHKPIKEKVDGSAAVNLYRELRQSTQAQSGDATKGKKKRGYKGSGESKKVVNLWRDVSSASLEFGEWKEYRAYKNDVQFRVVSILKKQLKGRSLTAPLHSQTGARPSDTSGNDIPF